LEESSLDMVRVEAVFAAISAGCGDDRNTKNHGALDGTSIASYSSKIMSTLARRFYLTCSILISLTCVLWSVITILIVFVWHTAPRDLRFAAPILLLAAAAITAFKFYNDERKPLR